MVLVNRTGGYPRWPTIQAFYDERVGERSGESHFGFHNWANPLAYRATSNDRWRVSVVDDTGDVYAFKEPGEPVMLLGTLLVTDADHECARRGHRISHPATYCAADRLFEGWVSRGGLGRPLHWFAERLASQQGVK